MTNSISVLQPRFCGEEQNGTKENGNNRNQERVIFAPPPHSSAATQLQLSVILTLLPLNKQELINIGTNSNQAFGIQAATRS